MAEVKSNSLHQVREIYIRFALIYPYSSKFNFGYLVSGHVKVNQKLAVFVFEILGLNPSFKASKSGFELYSAVCNC